MKAFINSTIFTGDKLLTNRVILVDGTKISGITSSLPDNVEIFDCKDTILAPGLIDLQIYGGGGYLFSSSLSGESLHAIANDLVSKGTTGFFITLATNSFQVFRKAVEVVRDFPHPAVLGIQLEGPYINPLKKGAHLEKYIKKPELSELRQFMKDADGVVKMMTVAPEQCDKDAIDLLLDHNVLISAGHSNATYDEAIRGFSRGIKATTHLFNAMSPLHHRDTGLPGAVLLSETVNSSIIPDGIHVDFEMVKIAKRLMNERLFFITDAVEEIREGEYIHIRQKDRFTLPDGTLSGSALTMPLAVKNGVERIGLPIEESLRMASVYPSKLAGLEGHGQIKENGVANFVCLSKDLELKFTVFRGEKILP